MAIVTICDTPAHVAARAAARVTALIGAAIAARGAAVVCLTGGNTVRGLYDALADSHHPWRGRIDWPRVHLLWGDERHVPPDHPDSNFGMAYRALVSRVPVAPDHVHRIRAELPDPAAVARDYDATLPRALAAAGRADLTFDLMLLGLGEDAHVASIFPGIPVPGHGRVGAVRVPPLGAWRITLTPRAILDARAILVMVTGAAKRDAVHTALDLPEDVSAYPAQLLRAAGQRVEWIMDSAAAARRRAAPPA